MNKLFQKKGTAENTKNQGFRESPVDAPNRQAINIKTNEFEIEKARDSWGLSMQLKKKLITIGLVFLCLMILRYTCSDSDVKKGEISTIQKNTDLESIENKIIVGLDGTRDKTKLLELVTQLNHDDVEHYITGKKQGIIVSDFRDPDGDFFGTYAQYWTGQREGYKEIILRNLSIQDYKKELTKKFKSSKAK